MTKIHYLLTEEETKEYRDLFTRLYDKGIYVDCTFFRKGYF